MKGRYEPIIEQAEKEETTKGRVKGMLTIIKMVTTNHLPCIEEKVDKTNKKLNKINLFLIALLLATLFSSKDSISWLWMVIMRLF